MLFKKKGNKPRTAILFYGMLRNYEIPSKSIFKNILEKNDCDIFYFGPSETDSPDINYAIGLRDKNGFFIKNPKEDKQKVTPSKIDGFLKIYGKYLKSYHVHENKTEFFEENISKICSREDWIIGLNPARMLSMFYNIGGVIDIFNEYCNNNNKKYDKIILTRTDIIFYGNIISEIKNKEMHIPFGEGFNEIGEKHMGNAAVFFYKNMETGDYVSGGRKDSFNDQIMLFSPNDITMFDNIYENVKYLIRNKVPLSPETILFILAKRNEMRIITHPEWEYEIYRVGKKPILSILDTDELKDIDRYHPKLINNNYSDQIDADVKSKDIESKTFNSIHRIINLISNKNKSKKLNEDPVRFFSNSNIIINNFAEKILHKELAKKGTFIYSAKSGSLKSDFGEVNSRRFQIKSGDSEGFAIYGPYATLDSGKYIAKFYFDGDIKHCRIVIDVVSDEIPHLNSKPYDLNYGYPTDCVSIEWSLPKEVHNLEVRIYVFPGFVANFDYLAIKKVD
ncbi:hypothetical protein [Komagataeibacter europaeus]|uniref:hypothetical protein n=1 Tax=Komagataeibacter europaeus TaxID=33995 RepID=UPI000237EFC9|nr:hypothetical protein [Komagataeibacter europaeus]